MIYLFLKRFVNSEKLKTKLEEAGILLRCQYKKKMCHSLIHTEHYYEKQ